MSNTTPLCSTHGLPVWINNGCHICVQEAQRAHRIGRQKVGCMLEKCQHCTSQKICQEIYAQDLWVDGDCPHYKPKQTTTPASQ